MATILIVDDDADIRRVLRALFERAGYQVSEAGSAAQALRSLMGADLPDAVVCDYLMPGPTGLDFYEELSSVAPTLKNRVVFLTGASQDQQIHDSIEEAGVPLLAKLDDLRLVVDAIRIALLGPR